MKILHTADWHIGDYKGPTEDGVNLRFKDIENCLGHMIDVAKEEKPDVVCISGDIFNQEQVGPVRYSKEMLLAYRTIASLSRIAKLVIVMRGTPNHDGAGQYDVLEEMFKTDVKVQVVTKPQVLSTPIADFVAIPGFDKQVFRANNPGLNAEEENNVWTEQIGQAVIGYRAACFNDEVPAILMAHFTVPGCNLESGQTSCYANFEPVLPREAIETAGFDACLLGHIHRPQKIERLPNVFYSGAINALNFNDEGQERGFWIHEFSGHELVGSTFHETPYRKFLTISWEEEDVKDYIAYGETALAAKYEGQLDDRIVRVRYSCTSKQRKALNVPALQNDLYKLGAFYVSDIEAMQTVEVNARGLLAEESDPLENLRKWLNEKCYPDADAIADLGQPIINAAAARAVTSDIHGVFRPVSIRVKNYRNYKEEYFEFDNVSFCSVNGVNGAGKSSLFFDAIMDCLYEETREGDQKAWIRGTADARSGMIEFIWEVGESRFRVVRTRTKSGKPTLNLSQLAENGEWINLSMERIVDTQAEILRILGMDPLTFKSCALIMQDQYGLFLQAKKDERIAVLSVLLGLGIYGDMEADARQQARSVRSTLMHLKDEQKIKKAQIDAKGDPASEIKKYDAQIKDIEASMKESQEKLEVRRKEAEERKRINDELLKISDSIDALRSRKREQAESKTSLLMMLDDQQRFLGSADHYRKKAEEYRKTEELLHSLDKEMAKFEAANSSLEQASNKELQLALFVESDERRLKEIDARLLELSSSAQLAEECEERIRELSSARKELEDIKGRQMKCAVMRSSILDRSIDAGNKTKPIEIEIRSLQDRLKEQQTQAEYLANAGCIDAGKASCRFLARAKREAAKENETRDAIARHQDEIGQIRDGLEEFRRKTEEDIAAIEPSDEETQTAFSRVKDLDACEEQKKKLESDKLEFARLSAEKESDDKIYAEHLKSLSTAKETTKKLTSDVSKLSEIVSKYQGTKERLVLLEAYPKMEAQIPLYEERRKTTLEKLDAVSDDLELIEGDIGEMNTKAQDLKELYEQLDPNAMQWAEIHASAIEDAKSSIADLQMAKGSAQQRLDDIEQLTAEVDAISGQLTETATKLNRFEILQKAFSQDGVPHQIIRNIIPHITDTANSILGSMTGGTMGVEFVLDKVTKGKDGEKATLDVMIEEYGKTTLPYSSKSGGEKVKASLAVILALAEIKTTAAGIQLGMLFIDEPPFLDADGTDAYVDALETIRQRYPAVKIMAITHDEAMKARFSQSVEIVKTDEGSKVIY